MRQIIFLFLLILPSLSGAQQFHRGTGDNVSGNKIVHNVTINVNGIVRVWNLENKKDLQGFIVYLTGVPGIDPDLKRVLQNERDILNVVKKINAKTENAGFSNCIELLDRLEKYVRENERLRTENRQLMEKTRYVEFAEVLKRANRRLEEYDNLGYQKELEHFKNYEKQKALALIQEIGEAAYLQSWNSLINYRFSDAELQVKEALVSDSGKLEYIQMYAVVMFAQGRFRESISAYQKITSNAPYDTVLRVAFSNMSAAYFELGDMRNALLCIDSVFSISERLGKAEGVEDVSFYNNAGTTLRVLGEYRVALQYLKHALNLNQKALGVAHTTNCTQYENIGAVYQSLGLYDSALYFQSRGLELCIVNFGESSNEAANCYDNIASVFCEIGKLDSALVLFKKVSALREQTYGFNSLPVALSYKNLAKAYLYLQKLDSAFVYVSKARIIREKQLGENSLHTAELYNDLAAVYNAQGKTDSAIYYYNKDLCSAIAVLGEFHPDVAVIYNNIGVSYYRKKMYDSAEKYYRIALDIQNSRLGLNSISGAVTVFDIATIYEQKEDYDSAASYYHKAKQIIYSKKALGHPVLKEINFRLGIIAAVNNDTEQAVVFFDAMDVEALDIINNLYRIALEKISERQFVAAVNILSITAILVPDGVDKKVQLSAIYAHIGYAYCRLNRKTTAENYFARALNFCSDSEKLEQFRQEIVAMQFKCGE